MPRLLPVKKTRWRSIPVERFSALATARPEVFMRSIGMQSNSELRSTLNALIQTCRDGQEGFLTAAENVQGDELKKLFNECSLQRSKFTGELQSLAHELGDSNPETSSSVTGTLHRGWINLKTAIVGRDQHAILAECERGEDIAVEEYRKALELDLPANIREVIQQQQTQIQATHGQVKAWRDAR